MASLLPIRFQRVAASRVVWIAVSLAFAFTALGARCIENVAVRTDGAGHTGLLGEIYNDTDVQGTRITVRATLLDSSGNVIATKNTTTCPPDLQPHGLSSYGVLFDELNLPPAASWDVRPIAGVTLDSPLPPSGIVISSAAAVWSGEMLNVTVNVTNNSAQTYRPQACAVTYDAANKVRSFNPFDPASFGLNSLGPHSSGVISLPLRGQRPDATTVRVWLWIPGTTNGTSPYQPAMTSQFAIQ